MSDNQIPPPLWWSPELGWLTRRGGMYWVMSNSAESLRHKLGTGPDSNPPLPDNAVPLASAGLLQEPQPAETAWPETDPRYLRYCDWPGCFRAYNVLNGPKPAVDGHPWIMLRRAGPSLLCPDHQDVGHRPQPFIWEPGSEFLTTGCECGETSGELRPTTLETCTTWWQKHVLAVAPARPAVDDDTASAVAIVAEALKFAGGMLALASRDWGVHRTDAWLWGLLCGWDCEITERGHVHDDTCGGEKAMNEMVASHAWSDDDVARLRRFRAAIRELSGEEGK